MRPSTVLSASLALAFLAFAPAAFADRDKDESGHGHKRHGGREFKEEYWDGNCKVERKLERNGDYKEERKCKGGHREHAHSRPVVVQPVTVIYPPWVVVEQGRPHRYRQGYEPAPVVQGQVSYCNSATVGKVLGGLGGALATTAGMFLPAFAFSLIFYERVEQVAEHPRLYRTLDGVAAAAVGIIAATLIQLGVSA